MSVDASNDTFRKNMLDEIKRIQNELIELKNIKENITKPARKTAAKKKAVKRKPARKTAAKRKARRQTQFKPNCLTNLCLNQYEYT